MARRDRRAPQHGISLVEALVALTILAFGLLASLGVQATFGRNADLARQRSEATRLAQSAIAQWREITSDARAPSGLGAPPTWGDIRSEADESITGLNATYILQREVQERGERKDVRVTVQWSDRQGQTQSVQLVSAIARHSLRSTALLVNAAASTDLLGPGGRHAAIPTAARDLGNGSSAFAPPASERSADAAVNNVWVFDNATGLVTSLCTASVDAAGNPVLTIDPSASGCRSFAGHFLSGTVRFATGEAAPSAADALAPTGTALNLEMRLALTSTQPAAPVCRDDAPRTAVAAAGRTAVHYYCLVPVNPRSPAWGGYVTLVPRAFSDVDKSLWFLAASDASFIAADQATAPATQPTASSLDPDETLDRQATATHRLCRYTPAASTRAPIANEWHPWFYRIVRAGDAADGAVLPSPALTHQNFLLILAKHSCPRDTGVDAATGHWVSGNTLFHAPWP